MRAFLKKEIFSFKKKAAKRITAAIGMNIKKNVDVVKPIFSLQFLIIS